MANLCLLDLETTRSTSRHKTWRKAMTKWFYYHLFYRLFMFGDMTVRCFQLTQVENLELSRFMTGRQKTPTIRITTKRRRNNTNNLNNPPRNHSALAIVATGPTACMNNVDQKCCPVKPREATTHPHMMTRLTLIAWLNNSFV